MTCSNMPKHNMSCMHTAFSLQVYVRRHIPKDSCDQKDNFALMARTISLFRSIVRRVWTACWVLWINEFLRCRAKSWFCLDLCGLKFKRWSLRNEYTSFHYKRADTSPWLGFITPLDILDAPRTTLAEYDMPAGGCGLTATRLRVRRGPPVSTTVWFQLPGSWALRPFSHL